MVKAIIDRTASNEALEAKHYGCKKETIAAEKASNEEEQKKIDLIIALENSRSFARTHALIGEMQNITRWSAEEKEE